MTPGGNVQAAIIVLPYQCDQKVTLQASAGFQNYTWNIGSGNNQSINANQSGVYTVTVTNAAGCTGTATVQANIPTPPIASISGKNSFCTGTSTTLSGSAGFAQYAWSGGVGNQQSATITQAGTYTITVTDLQGCTATASAQVTESNLNPTLQQNEVLCEGTTITISVTGTYTQYRWSDNSVQSSLIVSQPGTYTVTVTDAQGCTGSTTSVILAVPPAKVSISGPTALCKGNTITLTSTGSVGTFTWTGNVTGSTFTVTQPGTYSVTIRDVNGCTAATSTVVKEADPKSTNLSGITCVPAKAGIQTFRFTAANGCDSIVTITTVLTTKLGLELDLESPVNAKIGSEITLDIAGNFAIDSVRFVSPFSLSCSNCLDPKFKPAQSGVIQVTAFDEDGCSASGEIRIVLNKKFDIYVPNIFKPGSAQNGFFSVFSDIDIPNVRNFNVYDRWGNAIFSRDNMPTNDPTAGWDGSYRGQKMQPGVYVYYFVVDLPDGTEEVYSGDVTIVE